MDDRLYGDDADDFSGSFWDPNSYIPQFSSSPDNQTASINYDVRQDFFNNKSDPIYNSSSEDEFCHSSTKMKVSDEVLPEFIASGGNTGIFKLPLRAAVHPLRPPSLEIRPHPLRETQVGRFLRTIEAVDGKLWAGKENGVRVWNVTDFYSSGNETLCQSKGDEGSAPFFESIITSPTLCLVVDPSNRLVWSGHKDGKIRIWKMDQDGKESPFSENMFWHAHRTPVLSLTITCYGDLWSGSEGGTINVWPREVLENSLSQPTEERRKAALSVERSYIDLRNKGPIGGTSLSTTDIKYLLADNSGAKVWSGGYLSFALWDACSKDLLKIFGVDGQVDPRFDLSSMPDLYGQEEIRTKFVTTSKKEKVKGPINFFQRSRNALFEAADAVWKVASKGSFGADNQKIEAVVASKNGLIWTGCSNGSIVLWDGNGNRLHEFQHHSYAVQCLCSFGTRLWIGYASGAVQVLDLEGKLLGEWIAHNASIVQMAVGNGYVYTLAGHGGVRAWNMSSPCPLDVELREELTNKEMQYSCIENLKFLAGTWNVGQEQASHGSLKSWLGDVASDVNVVIVGLQEMEMGAGFLAIAIARETVGLEGSANGLWWLEAIEKILGEGMRFERIGSRQLAGLLIGVWVRKNIRSHVGDIEVAAVPCGFGRAIGNKGAVGLRMRIYDRIVCFVNCHFAAHLEAVHRRNADFDHVYQTMTFTQPFNGLNAGNASVSPVQFTRRVSEADESRSDLSEADLVVFLGDLNYRLDNVSYDEAIYTISQNEFKRLQEKDQLKREMEEGNVFQGMREGLIKFPPTYKFERHQEGLSAYDSSEKRRIPAWCDRILYRDSRSTSLSHCTLACPVVSSISQYVACMDVTDSDHKPVRCIFNVCIARVDESMRRHEFGKIISNNESIRSLLYKFNDVPEISVSTDKIILQNHVASALQITNNSRKDEVVFEIICEGESTIIQNDGHASQCIANGFYGFPTWLEIAPATGIIKPLQFAEVSVLHREFRNSKNSVDSVAQNVLCEDTRDKEVVLVVNVTGIISTNKRSHRIHVCHFHSSKTTKDCINRRQS